MCRCGLLGKVCGEAVSRRGFLRGCGVAVAATAAATRRLASTAGGAEGEPEGKPKVAVVFLAQVRDSWPYPRFDIEGRQREVMLALRQGHPQIDFVPVMVQKPDQLKNAIGVKDDVHGYLAYVVTLSWALRPAIVQLGQLGKPTLVANEFLGGCGAFLTGFSELRRRGIPAVGVSTTRLADLVAAAGAFAEVRKPGATPASFAQQCEAAYRRTFAGPAELKCADDPVPLTDIAECVKRFRQARFLIVGAGRGGLEQEFLGVKARYVDFDELLAFYKEVDRDEAAEWAARWSKQAVPLPEGKYVEPSRPTPEALQNAGGVYLATLKLLAKYGTDSVTMNCLGGFAAGKLPAYPCLGFMELLNAGGQGVCEAMPDDTLSMLLARILTGRPGFVSDPALDTAKNQVVYAHCVGTTRAFGPKGAANPFRLRTLHNRDPRGACAESLMPPGYMTTTFRTNAAHKQLVLHQAKALGALDSEHACRTKLIGNVRGDIAKLFNQWDRFNWHRVTVYGDVKEPLAELAKALGLEVIEEA